MSNGNDLFPAKPYQSHDIGSTPLVPPDSRKLDADFPFKSLSALAASRTSNDLNQGHQDSSAQKLSQLLPLPLSKPAQQPRAQSRFIAAQRQFLAPPSPLSPSPSPHSCCSPDAELYDQPQPQLQLENHQENALLTAEKVLRRADSLNCLMPPASELVADSTAQSTQSSTMTPHTTSYPLAPLVAQAAAENGSAARMGASYTTSLFLASPTHAVEHADVYAAPETEQAFFPSTATATATATFSSCDFFSRTRDSTEITPALVPAPSQASTNCSSPADSAFTSSCSQSNDSVDALQCPLWLDDDVDVFDKEPLSLADPSSFLAEASSPSVPSSWCQGVGPADTRATRVNFQWVANERQGPCNGATLVARHLSPLSTTTTSTTASPSCTESECDTIPDTPQSVAAPKRVTRKKRKKADVGGKLESKYNWSIEMLTMPRSEYVRFTRTTKEYTKDQLDDLRRARRRMKNRLYQKDARDRKFMKSTTKRDTNIHHLNACVRRLASRCERLEAIIRDNCPEKLSDLKTMMSCKGATAAERKLSIAEITKRFL